MLDSTPFTVTKRGRATYISFQLWPICSITLKDKEATLYNIANMTPNIKLYLHHLSHYLSLEGISSTIKNPGLI